MTSDNIKVYQEDNAKFQVIDLLDKNIFRKKTISNFFTVLWNKKEKLNLSINQLPFQMSANEMIFIPPYQSVQVSEVEGNCLVLQYNREFYCIIDHEDEVSCAGVLFYSQFSQQIIKLDELSIKRLSTLEGVLFDEFDNQDNLMGEMLRMLLKRLIIICTRLAKEQLIEKYHIKSSNLELIRQFNILVEKYFRTKHKVNDYAELMNRSPKTLTNIFAKNKQPSPSEIIQKRIIIEAKRLLTYTKKSSKEIAFELGFDEPANFTRYFKQIVKDTPQSFRKFIQSEP